MIVTFDNEKYHDQIIEIGTLLNKAYLVWLELPHHVRVEIVEYHNLGWRTDVFEREAEGNKPPETDTFTDERDGKVYRTVKIGEQVWMAENLNYETPDSRVYKNDPSNGEKYGRLYTWADARTACPVGWHLPTDAEWQTLVDFVDDRDTAGTELKSSTGWNADKDTPTGTDNYGFSALPGGLGGSGGGFYNVGLNGYWWSATEYNGTNVWYRDMYYDGDFVGRDYNDKTFLFSVRCVRD